MRSAAALVGHLHTPGRPAGSHGGAPAASLSLGRFERPGSMVALSIIELHLGAGPAAGLQNTRATVRRGHYLGFCQGKIRARFWHARDRFVPLPW